MNLCDAVGVCVSEKKSAYGHLLSCPSMFMQRQTTQTTHNMASSSPQFLHTTHTNHPDNNKPPSPLSRHFRHTPHHRLPLLASLQL